MAQPTYADQVVAGIVTYNPDIEILRTNISAVCPQVRRVIIFDNGSLNADDVRDAVSQVANASLLQSPENLGISAAFNRIAAAAIDDGAQWILTLDQDSMSSSGMVQTLLGVSDAVTPLVTPFIIDRNKHLTVSDFKALEFPPVQFYKHAASKGAITSGGLLNLAVLQELGGFDEAFFIDYVDYDLNMRIMRAGYRIARANQTYLLHEVGRANKTWLWTPRKTLDGRWVWERFYSFGHSPTRCYYKARNRILYSRKHWRHVRLANEGFIQIPQQVLLTVLFENERIEKLRAFTRGVIDGLRVELSSDT